MHLSDQAKVSEIWHVLFDNQTGEVRAYISDYIMGYLKGWEEFDNPSLAAWVVAQGVPGVFGIEADFVKLYRRAK